MDLSAIIEKLELPDSLRHELLKHEHELNKLDFLDGLYKYLTLIGDIKQRNSELLSIIALYCNNITSKNESEDADNEIDGRLKNIY